MNETIVLSIAGIGILALACQWLAWWVKLPASVAVVLFEGSLALKFSEIKGLERIVQRMVSTGVLSTWAVTTLAAYALLDISLQLALLFGALTVVTGPTVIVPMLRSVRPTAHLSSILRW